MAQRAHRAASQRAGLLPATDGLRGSSDVRGDRRSRPVPRLRLEPRYAWLAMATAVAMAAGCTREPESTAASSAPVVEPVFPSISDAGAPDGSAPASSLPEWAASAPDVAVPVESGRRAWAVTSLPGTSLAQVGVYTVGRIDGHTATVVDAQGQRVLGVPGAWIHPVGSSTGLKAGDVALAFSKVTSVVVARVTRSHGGRVQVQYDWAGTTRAMVADHVEPVPERIEPMAFVGYPKFGRTSRGLVVALSDEQAWIQTSSGHVEAHPRSKLEAIRFAGAGLGAGDPVDAYSWTNGYERGKVVRVVEPELRFMIELPNSHTEQPYFFADLRAAR